MRPGSIHPTEPELSAVATPSGLLGLSREDVARWGAKGIYTVLDQAFFAISNFLVHVLLARALAPPEYGRFVTSYTVMLFVGVLQTGLLLEAVLTFGAGKYREYFRDYFRVVQHHHWWLMAASSAVVLVGAVMLQAGGYSLMAQALLGQAIFGPFVLWSWLARRACYVVSPALPQWAAAGGAINLVVCVVGLIVLSRVDLLSVVTAQALLGLASVLSIGFMLVPISRRETRALPRSTKGRIWQEHLEYGRWFCGKGLLSWAHEFLYYLALPIVGGVGAAGSLRAASTLIKPLLQTNGALLTMMTPSFIRNRYPTERFRRLVRTSSWAFSLESFVYGSVLVAFGPMLASWVYGGTYEFDRTMFVLLAILPLLSSLSYIGDAALRADDRPEAIMWCAVLSTVGTVLGLVAMGVWGVKGAVLGWNLNGLATVIAQQLFLRRGKLRPVPVQRTGTHVVGRQG